MTRLDLHTLLVSILGSNNVYFQPPTNVMVQYPAFIYSRDGADVKRADNGAYLTTTRYQVMYVSKNPDNDVFTKMLTLAYCSYDRHYVSDNLHHDVFTLYEGQ